MKKKKDIIDSMNIPVKFGSTETLEGLPKHKVISEISEETGIKKEAVKEIYDTLVDIAFRELLTNGIFRIPGLITIHRVEKKETLKYVHTLGKSILYPSTCTLKSKVSKSIKNEHRILFQNLNNMIDGKQQGDDWTSDRIVCEGDYRLLDPKLVEARVQTIKRNLGEL